MFVDNYRKDFYEMLKGHRVLMLASCDIDSLAAVKTFQHLFDMDDILYTLAPVRGYEELKKKYADYAHSVKKIILINCGGTLDILNLFENVPSDAIFFILDGHRPFSLLNIYDDTKQVRIIGNPDDEKFPMFDELFMDMSDDEAELSSDDDSEVGPSDDEDMFADTREARMERRAEKRAARARKEKKRKEFEDKRNEVLLHYTEYNYYGKPASMLALTIALALSRANSEVVWWAIIGVTDCVRLCRIDRSMYTMLITCLQQHVNKVTHENENTLFNMKINMLNDLDVFMYRNWSFYESCKVTPNWVCTFKMWSVNGESKFKLFLAESGLALKQVRQKYEYMDPAIKKDLEGSIRRREIKYDLVDWTIGTFQANYGYRFRFTALDTHMAALGLLNAVSAKKCLSEKFTDALSSLGKHGFNDINAGLELTKFMLTSLYNEMKFLLSVDQISTIGTVIFACIGEGRFDNRFHELPCYMTLLAQFAQHAFIANSRSSKYKNMPFILMAPINEEYLVVIGVPPFSADITQNLFGKIFEQVGSKMHNTVLLDYFDSSMCKVKRIEKDDFIENVVSVIS